MSAEDEEFLNAGVVKYADAYAAVLEYRERVRALVERLLGEVGDDAWELPPGTTVKPTLSRQYGFWVGGGTSLELLSAEERAATIDVGLWWNWARTPHPVVVVAVFTVGPMWLQGKASVPPQAGVEFLKAGKKGFFYVVPNTEAPDLAADMRRLLEGVRMVVSAGAGSSPVA